MKLDQADVGKRCVVNSTNLTNEPGVIVKVKTGQFAGDFADVRLDGGKTVYCSSGVITLEADREAALAEMLARQKRRQRW